MRLLSLAAFCALVSAQTTAYLRDSGPGFWIVGATNATPIVFTANSENGHGLSVGDYVGIYNVVFDTGTGCGSNTMDGVYKVKAVVDVGDGTGTVNHFSVTDLSNVDVPAHGVWCDGHVPGGSKGSTQTSGKVIPYTLATGMKGWFDGDAGTYTRQISLGTNNGLTSLVVSGTTATVTTSFANYAAVGDQVAVWNSASATLNRGPGGVSGENRPYIVTATPTANIFTFTVSSVTAQHYEAVDNTCGPASNADCLRLSKQAVTGNPWWDAVKRAADANTICLIDGGSSQCNAIPNGAGNVPGYFHSNALRFLVDLKDTHSLTMIKYWLNHVERSNGVNWAVPEDRANINDIDFMSYAQRDMAPLYNVGAAYLSPSEKTTFLNKIFNDIRGPGAGCNKVIPYQKPGTSSSYANISTTHGILTGVGTLWQSDPDPTLRVTAGDALYIQPTGIPTWGGEQFYVNAVLSDTSLDVNTHPHSLASFTNANPPYLVHQWVPGDCGVVWMQEHWIGAIAQANLYPPVGGVSAYGEFSSKPHPIYTTNNGFTYMAAQFAMGLATADDDPRGLLVFERVQANYWNWALPVQWGYVTGFDRAGTLYSFQRNQANGGELALYLSNSVLNFPDLDLTGYWQSRFVWLKIYGLNPYQYNGSWWVYRWGTETGVNNVSPFGNVAWTDSWMMSWILRFAPASVEARYWKQFLTDKSLWLASQINNNYAAEMFSANGNPMVGATDYKTLPTQVLLNQTSYANNPAHGINNYNPLWRGDGIYSRTGWTSESDTLTLFQARAFLNDHDLPQGPQVRIYKHGPLLSDGYLPAGSSIGSDSAFPSYVEPILQFGETNATLYDGSDSNDLHPNTAGIDRWAGATMTGDPNSNYVYARADAAGMYKIPITRAKVHFLHLKKPATEEIVMKYVDVDLTSSPTSVRSTIHYPQNLETGVATQEPEGDTSCPGGGASCVNLDSTRVILSQESGTAPYTDGVITKIFSPGTVKVQWDGTGYTNNVGGHDYRVSICGGGSCGATVSKFDFLEVHKVSAAIADNTLTATALNPDTGWTGAQTLDKVALFARNGATPCSITPFTTTHSGTAQYLIAGICAGTVSVLLNGSQIAGSPFTVQSGDNSLYFESTAGTLTISGGPVLTATPGTVTLSATTGGSHPATNVAVAALGTTLDNWSATTGQSWIGLTPASGTAPGNLAVSVSCDALSPGSYSGSVSIGSTTANISNSPVTVSVAVTCYAAPSITTASPLPGATRGVSYTATFAGTDGQAPYTWSLLSGSFPTGLTLSGAVLSGTPTVFQTSTFTIRVMDAGEAAGTKTFTLAILAPPGGATVGNAGISAATTRQ